MSSIGEGEFEVAQIRAVLNCAGGSANKPLLVLSCISREEPEATRTTSQQDSGVSSRCRTPCVYMAKRLGLPELSNSWMVIFLIFDLLKDVYSVCLKECQPLPLLDNQVQDTVAQTLSGLLDGISWLLRASGVKLYGS